MREAPSRVSIRALLRCGARLRVYDPIAMDEARRCIRSDLGDTPGLMSHIEFADSHMGALEGDAAPLIVTGWKAFRSPDFVAVKTALNHSLIFDGRNWIESAAMTGADIEYRAVGRSAPKRLEVFE